MISSFTLPLPKTSKTDRKYLDSQKTLIYLKGVFVSLEKLQQYTTGLFKFAVGADYNNDYFYMGGRGGEGLVEGRVCQSFVIGPYRGAGIPIFKVIQNTSLLVIAFFQCFFHHISF